VSYVWQQQRDAVPRMRADLMNPGPAPLPHRPAPPGPDPSHDDRVFSGGGDGEARGVQFAGPDEPAARS
jgi:hypothetical protein